MSGPLATLVREAARWAPGQAVGRALYLACADLAARWLGELGGVEAVMLAGSLTRPERIEPGWSDIDLVLLCDTDLDGELALRRTLRGRLERLHGIVPAFRQLDVLTPEDLPRLRVAPNAWSMDFDRRWRCIAGTDPLEPSSAALPREDRRREQLRRALRRWVKASPHVCTNGAGVRVAAKLLRDVVALACDADRYAPWDALRAHDDALPTTLDDPGACTRAALRVLERFAEEGAGEGEAWPAEGSPAGGERALRHAWRDPAGVVRATFRLDDGFVEGPEPVLTPPLWRAAWLLDPAPFVGLSLSLDAPAPPAPSAEQLGRALPSLRNERRIRARGRRLRMGPSARDAAVAMWREAAVLAPALADLAAGRAVRFEAREAPTTLDERSLLAALREEAA